MTKLDSYGPGLVKAGALSTLVLQNSALALVMRYTRTASATPQTMYIPTTAVVMAEAIKVAVALAMQLRGDGSLGKLRSTVHLETIGQPLEFLKMAVPALLYTLQNNLSYVATSHLDGPTYQIICQSKILITALLSVLILQRSLTRRKWVSLVVLTAGVGMVQLSSTEVSSNRHENSALGFASAFLLCLFSGLAGVYFELVLKGTKTSLWMRNIQLGSYGIVIGLAGVLLKDAQAVAERGFFSGYNAVVWICICLHSLGGLAVAVVVKYADNVVKCFATSISIVLSCVLSMALFDMKASRAFMLGTSLVLGATYLYNTVGETLSAPRYEKVSDRGLSLSDRKLPQV